ncbi:MAG: hypothetical protein V4487_01185 [Chlamydiota bacterium]
MASFAQCIGGVVVCGGLLKIGELLDGVHTFITKDPRRVGILNDTKAKQICRIFARVLEFIGLFAAAAAIFTIGAALWTSGVSLGFIAAAQLGLGQSLPALITCLATITLSQIGEKLGN